MAPIERDATQVGNYFVSAYPPFSCWSAAGIEAYRRALHDPGPGRDSEDPAPLILYVHLPFCVHRCSYCYYLAYDNQLRDMSRYVSAVLRELALYAATPALAGRQPSVVYFGGGTPSLLSLAQLRRLLGGLQAVAGWDRVREATFECAPRSATTARLAALRSHGITRLSLGVQQLDDEVLAKNGRVHLTADAERAYARARRAGFDEINLDLIVGLVGETDASFMHSLERVIDWAPDSVTIYQLEIPYNTPLSRSMRDGTLQETPASWGVKRARLATGFARLEHAGYVVRSAYQAVRDPERPFLYQDEQYRGADLLGLGASSFSYVAGIHQQNRADLSGYLESIDAGELPLWRAHVLDDDERLVREFVLQLKVGRVDAARLRARYGVEVARRFAEPLARFAERGWLETDADGVTPTREGLLRVDAMIPEFYLPRHRVERYA